MKSVKDLIEQMEPERQERIEAKAKELLAEVEAELEAEFRANKIHRGTKE